MRISKVLGPRDSDMRTNLKGKIRNYNVPKDNPLLALHEAVVNSFHSIYEARTQNRHAGSITVRILREDTSGNPIVPINGFSVTDDGIGFNDTNFESFCTAESTNKEDIGGKGVGRFAWLVVFKKAEVDSVYGTHAGTFRRAFIFNDLLEENLAGTPCTGSETSTTVKMVGAQEDYYRQIPKNIGDIAQALVEHCAPLLMRDDAPAFTLIDGETSVDLLAHFHEFRSRDAYTDNIVVGGKDFTAIVFRFKKGHHKISFAAHGRLVTSRNVKKMLPGIPATLGDDEFVIACYVQGAVLDA
ncbi:MAG: hypothetical protein EOO38_20945, partial [Cytophagaceae bacterium]